jgi:hypothetical protein
MTVTQYFKGKNMRMDSAVSSSMVVEVFFIDSKTYSCTKASESTPFMCFESSSGDDTTPETADNLKDSESDYVITPLPDRTIAGIPAKCFTFTAKSGGLQNADYCMSTDGIILSVTGSEVSMVATSVQRGIADSVFTLPAEPTKLG